MKKVIPASTKALFNSDAALNAYLRVLGFNTDRPIKQKYDVTSDTIELSQDDSEVP